MASSHFYYTPWAVMRPPFWSNSDDPAGKVRWLYDIDPNYIQWQGAMISQYFPISSYKGSQEPIVTPLPFFDRDQELDDLEKRTKDLSIVNETKEAEVRAKIGCAWWRLKNNNGIFWDRTHTHSLEKILWMPQDAAVFGIHRGGWDDVGVATGWLLWKNHWFWGPIFSWIRYLASDQLGKEFFDWLKFAEQIESMWTWLQTLRNPK